MKRSAVFQGQAPADQVFAALVNGLPMVAGFAVDGSDPATGRIWASSGRDFRSDGSVFHLSVSAQPPGSTTVEVESRTILRTALTDWGKTKADFAQIKHLVETGRPGEPDGHPPNSFRGRLASLRDRSMAPFAGGLVGTHLTGWSWWSLLGAPVGGFVAATAYGAWGRRQWDRRWNHPW